MKDNPPKDAPYGGFGPDLPCYPPLSHGSSRFEIDDRRTRDSELRTGGTASLLKVKLCSAVPII